jgi:hypothetical protein
VFLNNSRGKCECSEWKPLIEWKNISSLFWRGVAMSVGVYRNLMQLGKQRKGKDNKVKLLVNNIRRNKLC